MPSEREREKDVEIGREELKRRQQAEMNIDFAQQQIKAALAA